MWRGAGGQRHRYLARPARGEGYCDTVTPIAAAMVRVSCATQAVSFHEESRKGQHGQMILFILTHSQHAQGFL